MSLIADLRAKIQACVDAEKRPYDGTDESRHATIDAGLALDDFVTEHGEALVSALAEEKTPHDAILEAAAMRVETDTMPVAARSHYANIIRRMKHST